MAAAKKRVVIIGAGVSGLSCARQLAKYRDEIEVTILEASNRIGGRVHSYIADDGTVLELGAQYIHGTIGNPIYDFAVGRGIIDPTEDWEPYEVTQYFEKTVIACEEDKARAVDLAFDYKEQLIDSLIESDEIPGDESLGHYLRRNFEDFKRNFNGPLNKCLEAVLNYLMWVEASFNGCPYLEDLDLKSYKNYIDLPGNQHFISVGSYSKITDALYSDIPEDWLKKNHKVSCIEYDEAEDNLVVKCDNKARFDCDVVVVTVSLEVLKEIIMKEGFFKPPLPVEKAKSLSHMKLSRVVKLFFKFTRVFPNEKVKFLRFYSSSKYSKETPLSRLTQFDRIGESDWWLIWINGGLLDEYERCYDKAQFLKTCLATVKENFLEFPKDLEIDTDSMITTGWTDDPLYLGGYSYFKCGGDSKRDIEILRKPVVFGKIDGSKTRHLLFSGEITEDKYYSTTHAAFESGIRDGKLVEDILKLNC